MSDRKARPFVSTVAFDPDRIRAASVYCSDGRYGEQIDEFLHRGLGLPRYDRIALPGGPACYSGELSVFWEAHSAERQLEFLCRVHQLERLVFIAHQHCAFYLETLKIPPERLERRQLDDVVKAATRVRIAQPQLAIDAYFAHRTEAQVSFHPIALPAAVTSRRGQ
jgi:hypothetical protein